MTSIWHASIQGMPWNEEKMNQAVQHLRRRATVHFRVGVDTYEDLTELDMNVFAARHDLILHISNADPKAEYPSSFLGRLAQLKHVSALQLDCAQVQDLTILGSVRKPMSIQGLEQMHGLEYLHVSLPKLEQCCDFSQMPRLRQLELVYMKSLQDIECLWTARALEVLELKEINTAIKAASFVRLAELERLRQVDFRFIDFNKGRIAAIREQLIQQGKSHIIYEHIPEQQRVQSMAIEHLSQYLM
nr:hypothetical protein [Paenibacillus xylanexedens]